MINIPLSTVENLGKHQNLAEILTRLKQEFQQIYQDNLISLVLFGSQARGDAKPDSDIDVLVVLKEKITLDNKRQKIIEFISDICIEYGVLVSCVYVSEYQFKQEKSPLLLNIHQEGIFL
ncbi:MAG: nucleotidyltransferase domain-containing protein [Okeania sp. SIO3H1]|uniref:nucleotidyltransferase family protein n=1 Tax=Okeania sp. SIO1I7 TaxID=2607772 RepID=UPI0013C70E91|nr:nucleotidyltransferase domain-containing protein [Okeania sp. SIO1I7]NEN89209.1 nucleotidyltransferase domain-containing protein [Okeania sp. SIO3H1]NET29699.1 nucleotidyltransferase domain-containing protein [Okeania sp. SIO1I7]